MGYQERKKDPQKKLTVGILKEMLDGILPNAEVQIRFGRYLMRMGEKIGVYEKGDTKNVYLFPIEKKQNNEDHRKSRNISLWKSFFYQLAKLLKWDIKKFIPQDIKNNLDCRTIYKKRNCCFYYRKGDIMFSFNFIKKAKSIKQCKVIKCDCFSKQKVIYPSYHRKK